MFFRIKVWKVTCEKCGKVYASGENSEDYFPTKKVAIEIISDEDWWHIRNGKVYCDDCFVY